MLNCDECLTMGIQKQATFAIPITEDVLVNLCQECLTAWEKEVVNGEITEKSKWNKVNEFKDCPSLNKNVYAVHDDQIFKGIFEKDGKDGYAWRLEDERSIQWVGIYDVEFWLDVNQVSQ